MVLEPHRLLQRHLQESEKINIVNMCLDAGGSELDIHTVND